MMTILDTNVISETIKPRPLDTVVKWLRSLPRAQVFTTSITQAEMLAGIASLPEGKRRTALSEEAEGILTEDFSGRILPFDTAAARAYAEIVSARRRLGRPISTPDAQIAAIARAHSYALATRNAADFQDCGIAVINPWQP